MIKKCIRILMAGITAVLILSVFCVFYQNDGINIANPNHATDYTNIPNSIKATMAEGFCFFRMDKRGYNNQTDQNDIDILLMGSSHVESAHLQPEYSINNLLNNQISDYYTYNIGIPGHTIYRCADNLKSAVRVFNPKYYVIIETSTVKLNIQQMQRVLNGTAAPIQTHDTGMLYYLQKVPALKVLFNQMSLWSDMDKNGSANANEGEFLKEKDNYDDILNTFLAYMRSEIPDGCELIIFYHPTAKVRNGNYSYVRDTKDRNTFQMAAEKNGILFIDMTDVFQSAYETDSCLTHGFINSAVEKGHINRFGNQLIANEIARVIMERKR